jgi:hypothetical protein
MHKDHLSSSLSTFLSCIGQFRSLRRLRLADIYITEIELRNGG